MDSMLGKTVDRYHIIEALGEGGMAMVYRAYGTRLECDVAVKFIRTQKLNDKNSTQVLRRFKREAQKTAGLNHPKIVPVIDNGEDEDIPYLVLKYKPRETLMHAMQIFIIFPIQVETNWTITHPQYSIN